MRPNGHRIIVGDEAQSLRRAALAACDTPLRRETLSMGTVIAERAESLPEIRTHALYWLEQPELRSSFLVAIPAGDQGALILTRRPGAYSELLRREGIRIRNTEDALRWARFGLELTRAGSRSFKLLGTFDDIPNDSSPVEVIRQGKEGAPNADGIYLLGDFGDMPDEDLWPDNSGKVAQEKALYGDVIRPLVMVESEEGAFTGTAFVLLGHRLVKREVRIMQDGGFSFADEELASDVGVTVDLHCP